MELRGVSKTEHVSECAEASSSTLVSLSERKAYSNVTQASFDHSKANNKLNKS